MSALMQLGGEPLRSRECCGSLPRKGGGNRVARHVATRAMHRLRRRDSINEQGTGP